MLSQFVTSLLHQQQTAVATGDWLRRFFIPFLFLFFFFSFLPRFVRIVRRSTAAPFSAPFCFCRFLSRIQAQFVPIVTGAFPLPFSPFSLFSFLFFFSSVVVDVVETPPRSSFRCVISRIWVSSSTLESALEHGESFRPVVTS